MHGRLAFASIIGGLVFASNGPAQQAIFLVRHAEKETDRRMLEGVADKDLPLNAAGTQRAKALAAHLKDAGIDAVYTSFAKRAIDTAAPLAAAIGKGSNEIKRDTISTLGERHKNQIVVIVAHSAGALGVPQLIDQITGKRNAIKIDESEFDHLFMLLPKKDGSWSISRARYGASKSLNQ